MRTASRNHQQTPVCIAACAVTLVAALVTSGGATAQPADPERLLAARDLTPLLRALDSDSLEQRESAIEQLGANPVVTLREVLGLLKDVSALTPEQRARLLDLARQMFQDSPRAAMGIQFGGTVDTGVAIAMLIDGFDASRQLRPGDVIETANGQALSQNRLRSVIVSHDPGESMDLRIKRTDTDGAVQTLDVSIVLGSFNRLRGGGFLDSQTLDEAWRVRLARTGIAGTSVGDTIGNTIDREVWLASAQTAARWATIPGGPGTARAPRADVAGEARSEWSEPESDLFTSADLNGMPNARDPGLDPRRLAMFEELQILQIQTEALRAGQRANLASLQSTTLAPSERVRLISDNERIGRDLLPLERRMIELRAQLSRRQ